MENKEKVSIASEATEEKKVRRGRRSKAEIEAAAAAQELADKLNETQKTIDKAGKTASKKNSNGQKVRIPERGQFNSPTESIEYERMYVELELMESALGTSPSSKDLLEEFIASNAPDALTRTEEIAAIGESSVVAKGTTIFPRGCFVSTENGNHMVDLLDNKEKSRYGIGRRITPEMAEAAIKLPYYYDYQIRGMFKDSCGLLARGNYGKSAGLKAYKKVIDGGIFISPRRIAIEMPEFWYEYDNSGSLVKHKSDPANLAFLSRPLLTSGPSGTNTAIARSEIIPAGSRIKFCIEYVDPSMKETIIEWLNYGTQHGLGAWRNSGRGSFVWREINPDYSYIEDSETETAES